MSSFLYKPSFYIARNIGCMQRRCTARSLTIYRHAQHFMCSHSTQGNQEEDATNKSQDKETEKSLDQGSTEQDNKDDPNKKTRKDPKDIKEFGGPKGPEPTRYGDWEKNGRVSDF